MFEAFTQPKAANDNQAENVEVPGVWRERKEKASEDTKALLEARGLATDVEKASFEELQKLVETLPTLIDELSYDSEGNLRNENRFLVQILSVYQNKAEKRLEYENAPSPAEFEFKQAA